MVCLGCFNASPKRPKVHEAGNKLRATVREEVAQIVAVVKG
jgi:hypothetical protein